MQIKYVGPFGEIEIPDLGISVKHGDEFEAVGDDAKNLLAQKDNFEAGKSTTKSKDN